MRWERDKELFIADTDAVRTDIARKTWQQTDTTGERGVDMSHVFERMEFGDIDQRREENRIDLRAN